MRVTVAKTFHDGNLSEKFSALGYPATWKAGEWREIPPEVLKLVVASGGMITVPDDNAKESKVVVGAEPQHIDGVDAHAKKFAKQKTVEVVFPKGFKDGGLTELFEAINHPAEIGVGEIIELPVTLLEKIKLSGGESSLMEQNPEVIALYRDQQAKHLQRIKEWKENRVKMREYTERTKTLAAHNESVLSEIETLSSKLPITTGKAKITLKARIDELYKDLK